MISPLEEVMEGADPEILYSMLGQKHFKSNEDAKKKKIRHSVTVGEKKADKKGGKNVCVKKVQTKIAKQM